MQKPFPSHNLSKPNINNNNNNYNNKNNIKLHFPTIYLEIKIKILVDYNKKGRILNVILKLHSQILLALRGEKVLIMLEILNSLI